MSDSTFKASPTKGKPVLAPADPPSPVPDVRKRDPLESLRESSLTGRATIAGLLYRLLALLASLRITVVLFALSLGLVFFGTIAMMDVGIATAVHDYFRSYTIVWIPLEIFAELGQVFFGVSREVHLAGSFPYPGGWLLGGLLLVNLLAAHIVRFRLTWRRSGILVLHSGIVVLMIGELITGLFAVEGSMIIVANGSANYTVHQDRSELAILTPAGDKEDDVVVIPDGILRRGGRIENAQLPFDVEVLQYMTNSRLTGVPAGAVNPADRGEGLDWMAQPRAESAGADPQQTVNVPSAYVQFLKKGTSESLGKYLVSGYLGEDADDPAQQVTVGGKTYQVALRFEREYKPYTVYLNEFHHELYPGTTKPKDFSSYVRLKDPTRGVDREARIWMNHPLSYAGETFYQQSFLKNDAGTVLQVVRNPGDLLPYLGCLLVAGGMLLHFGLKLTEFLNRTLARRGPAGPVRARAREPMPVALWAVPVAVLSAALLYLFVMMLQPHARRDELNLQAAAEVPVLDGGRIKPLDTVARTNLMMISGKQQFEDETGNTRSAVRWLFDVMTSRLTRGEETPPAMKYKVFRIDNLEVLNLLGLERRRGFRYALEEFADKVPLVAKEADRARQLEPGRKDLFDIKILELEQQLGAYVALVQVSLRLVPPAKGGDPNDWQDLRVALHQAQVAQAPSPAAERLRELLVAYADNNTRQFNEDLADYGKLIDRDLPVQTRMAGLEVFYNHFQPFYQCAILYGIVFVLVCVSWLWSWSQVWLGRPVRWAAFWLLVLTLAVHTLALMARMYLQGRPPVTNLYSSAVFIGWGCVVLGVVLELLYRIGIGTAVGSLLGLATSFISIHLATGGDTLEMMEAVLDTNFWLATHVTSVTLGYTATFVAGFLGITYLVCRLVARLRNPRKSTLEVRAEDGGRKTDVLRVLTQMTYGVVCFAMLFSFTGTVLGGIWADESWGRFWGWDPKENGALLIVIWNALILHARWGGLIKAPGLGMLAVVGNMVTGWSWFGTNQLGVGLHAYGFNDTLAVGLRYFWISQVGILGVVLAGEAFAWWRLRQPPRQQ
jgi:cytochrome c-type biogenesis protein CcsB